MSFAISNHKAALNNLSRVVQSGLGAPLMLIVVMAMMIVPLPPIALDIFFTFNIAFALVILLVVVYIMRPLEFAAFPTILLLATLMRLSLNVASTRVVLLEGHEGPGAAGKVIESFGEFVIGGNYAVGLIVFIILIVINFVVVTKGAGRISEVTARFTLDALPGKQMSIDADLNSGIIGQEEARERRVDVAREADFYGAMDGASKFVKGDAIAGLVILFINIVGGLLIGMLQHDLPFSVAMENYTLLTIGDGLVAQIPSLILSTGAAIIITRVSDAEDMGDQITGQLFNDPRPLAITAGILGFMGIIPGMPNLAFLTFAVVAGIGAWLSYRKSIASSGGGRGSGSGATRAANGADEPAAAAPAPNSPADLESRDLSWDDVPAVDVIGLEVGYGLIPLVDRNQGGLLMNRIKGVRKKLSQELGFLVPAVHIRDDLSLPPNNYRVSLLGVSVAEAELLPGKEMAINPGTVYGQLDGVDARDPAFDLDAVWIDPGEKDKAQTYGYTVVDCSTVVATHLSQLLKGSAHQLLGYEEVQQLLDTLGRSAPKLVEDLVPGILPLSVVVKVLQSLLQESVSIRDMRTIAEVLADQGTRTQDASVLTSHVRMALSRMILQNLVNVGEDVPVMTLDPNLEQILLQGSQQESEGIGFEPNMAERMHAALNEATQEREVVGEPAILLVPSNVRAGLARWLRHSIPSLSVLSYNEIPEDRQIKVVSTISG